MTDLAAHTRAPRPSAGVATLKPDAPFGFWRAHNSSPRPRGRGHVEAICRAARHLSASGLSAPARARPRCSQQQMTDLTAHTRPLRPRAGAATLKPDAPLG